MNLDRLLLSIKLKVASLFESGDYWDARYRAGDNSGEGSYGKFAKFKAQVLNQFVDCLLYTSPSPRDQRGTRMPSSA